MSTDVPDRADHPARKVPLTSAVSGHLINDVPQSQRNPEGLRELRGKGAVVSHSNEQGPFEEPTPYTPAVVDSKVKDLSGYSTSFPVSGDMITKMGDKRFRGDDANELNTKMKDPR